jgi:ribonuclease BN (tRNA processing enzyme)
VVDFGRGWMDRFYEAGLAAPLIRPEFAGLQSLRAAFITHLHTDHVVDYPRLLLFGATDGLPRRKVPVQIFGPGRRGELPKSHATQSGAPPQIINPDNPTPGTVDMTNMIYNAFATDLNDNILDSGMPHPSKYINVRDIEIPPYLNASARNPSPRMGPFMVYEDEKVRVYATLVSHPEVFPAFAYRFDTANGSIVISGDTNRSENLLDMAKGVDILVHEVMDLDWAKGLFPAQRTPDQEAKLDHLIRSHTITEDLAALAHEAGVKMLVLSHLGPPNIPDERYLSKLTAFTGKVRVGKPLMTVTLPGLE